MLPVLLSFLPCLLAIEQYDVMVTAGANQAFTNIVLTLCDAGDRVVLFKPYYFNHLMALQMTGGAAQVVLGPCNPNTLHPDLQWLEQQLRGPDPPKMVVLVNPCNPTGKRWRGLGLEHAWTWHLGYMCLEAIVHANE